jgi:hypothetical protein
MEKLHFSINIHAPKEKVWDVMLGEESYKKWTDVFMAGSYYEGDWNEGSKMLFLAPDESGKMGGMVSRIKENRLYEYISIEHLGMVQNGIEDTSSDDVKKWAGALENYTFKENNGTTEVLVDLDSNEEYKEMFEGMWPKALQKLKKLAENS